MYSLSLSRSVIFPYLDFSVDVDLTSDTQIRESHYSTEYGDLIHIRAVTCPTQRLLVSLSEQR